MARLTTIVALVADDAREIVQAVAADAMNVTAVLREAQEELDSTFPQSAAWRQAERGSNVYTLIDFDPMESVVAAWTARLEGAEHSLDVEVGRTGRIELPEYVLVADDIEDGRVHWYHGHLRSYAPRRVLTTKPTPAAVHRRLSQLRSDRPLPRSDEVALAALDYSPTTMSSSEATNTAVSLTNITGTGAAR